MTENCRAVTLSAALDSNANQQSLLVLINDVNSAYQSNLLPVRHRLTQCNADRRTSPSECNDIEDSSSVKTIQLGDTTLDVHTPSMTSPSSSSSSSSSAAAAAAACDVTDCRDDADVMPTDDAFNDASDDVLRSQNFHVHRLPMIDKVHCGLTSLTHRSTQPCTPARTLDLIQAGESHLCRV